MQIMIKMSLTFLSLVLFLSCTPEPPEKSLAPRWGIVIHTGAGSFTLDDLDEADVQDRTSVMTEALSAGHAILKAGGSSMDAVEAAIVILEDSPLFNAGKGAVFTHEGTNEMDAAIMDGKTLNAGAVAGLKHVKNPIRLARKIMDGSPHVMMIGEGAENYGRETGGIEFVPKSYFYTDKRWEDLQKILKREKTDEKVFMNKSSNRLNEDHDVYGTVGAVALDKNGNLAAATSTGGMTNKRYGRVGDVPIIGAGTYANNASCAVSATGHGEYFIRFTVSRDISGRMEYAGYSLQAATDSVVLGVLKRAGGKGAVISIDHEGNVAVSLNDTGMGHGYMGPDGKAMIRWNTKNYVPF